MAKLVEIHTIGIGFAIEIREQVIRIAEDMNVSGFVVIFNRTGMLECAQAVGPKGTPMNVVVAMDKIKTVLNFRRSTIVQRKRMEARNQSREDFAGQLGSLFRGGIAIFSLEGEFIGAIAFSGGTEEEDEEICKQAVEAVGLATDISAMEIKRD